MNNLVFLLLFMSVFHIVGGVGLGWALRQILARQFSCTVLFLIIWGGMMGVLPLAIGASSFLRTSAWYLLAVEVALLALVIGLAAFVPTDYLASFGSWQLMFAGIGGLFIIVGAILFGTMLRQSLVFALLIGGVFMLVGGGIFAAGVISALRNRS